MTAIVGVLNKYDFCNTELLGIYTPQDIQLTESEKKAIEKIQNAQSQEEVVNVMSDELVRFLMEQLKL